MLEKAVQAAIYEKALKNHYIEEKEVCIPDILHDLKTIIQGNIQAKQQDLYIDTQDVVHENVITDRLRLNQILLNIVSNAIKFTPVGGMVNIRVSEKPCNRKGFTTFVAILVKKFFL